MQTILNENFYPLKDFRVNEEKMISNGLETEIIKKPNKYFWKKDVFYDSKPFWKVRQDYSLVTLWVMSGGKSQYSHYERQCS